MNELKRAKMDLPPAPDKSEEAQIEFGAIVKTTFSQETGIRIPAGERAPSSVSDICVPYAATWAGVQTKFDKNSRAPLSFIYSNL